MKSGSSVARRLACKTTLRMTREELEWEQEFVGIEISLAFESIQNLEGCKKVESG